MSASTEKRTLLRKPALLFALPLGVMADLLIRDAGQLGLNVALWALAGVAALVFLLRRRSAPATSETRWLVGGALALAVALVGRDADALRVFSMLAAVALLIMAAGRSTAAWVTRAQISDGVFAAVRVVLLCAAGPIGWGRAAPDPDSRTPGWARHARTVARGALMALPALLLLTALLMAADPVFDRVVQNVFRIDLETLVPHVVFSAAIAWLTAGFLRALLVRDERALSDLRVPQPAIASAEISVALWMLNLLFAAFMVVQLRYLFGGAAIVEVTAGLSYAQYARRGFFELVTCTALVVPILLVADWAAAPNTPRARAVLRATMLVLVVLLFGVIGSAAYRMKLYQDAYGLTEERLYVSVIIVWLSAVLGWLALTVLRGRRERFAFGSIVAGLSCIVALHVLNPHALIARVNIDRAAAGAEYDGAYLQSLSADAVATLLARMDKLTEVERCRTSRMIKERWTGERMGGWRSWNLSDWNARRLVAPRAASLACPGVEVPATK